MKKLLYKELRLSSSPLSYLFIAFGLIALCPGYPILVGAFFVCLGIFQTFQASREANDLLYTLLLPVKKSDAVKSRYLFCIFIELCSFALSAVVTLLRMTVFSGSTVYRNNALMNANFVYLGFLLLIFGLFNAVFVGGYFKTAYKFAKPFVAFIVCAFLTVGVAESLHYLPGLGAVNSFGFDCIGVQCAGLAVGAVLYLMLTVLSERRAEKNFERIDL